MLQKETGFVWGDDEYPSRRKIFDALAPGEAVEFLCVGTHHKSVDVAKASVRSAVNTWRRRQRIGGPTLDISQDRFSVTVTRR